MEYDYNLTTIERKIVARASQENIPVTGSIELLPLCNMNCDMCYVRLSPETLKKSGRVRTMEEWISIAKEMQECGVLYLLLTGGEPLMYPDFRSLYQHLQALGMVLTINTNGTLINKSWIDFFTVNRPRRINITLYGASVESYENLCHFGDGFYKVIEAVRLLRRNNIDVKLSTSVTKKNVNDLSAMHALADQLGVILHADTYMMPSVRERNLPFAYQVRLDPEEAAKARIYCLQREFDADKWQAYRAQRIYEVENILPGTGPYHNICHAGRCSFTINWQGDIHPCVVLDTPAASVFNLGFRNAWNKVSQDFGRLVMNEKCNACNLRPVCRTCLACTKLETGDYDNIPDYMCRYAAEFYRRLREEQGIYNEQ